MITVQSEDIHCEGCVNRIDKAFSEEGIVHEINLEEKTVKAECALEKAIEILDDLGFDAAQV